MPAYVDVQREEFAREAEGYTATKHQREAGTGYFDEVLMAITGGEAATGALAGSTEEAQFRENSGARVGRMPRLVANARRGKKRGRDRGPGTRDQRR
jgi:hypothetical protein